MACCGRVSVNMQHDSLVFGQINQNYPDNCEPTKTIDGCTG